VPWERVRQAEPFPVFAVDLQPAMPARLSLARDEEIIELGTAQADGFGHFETQLTVPAGYPDGYSALIAVSPDGTQASTWILIGEADGSPPPPPPGAAAPAWWLNPSVLVLAVLLGGSLLLLGWRLLTRPPERR
jgi:hypothetical protein